MAHIPKVGPDYLLKRRIKIDEKYAEADGYKKKMGMLAGTTGWFESKIKYDFQDGEKRQRDEIKMEIEEANIEIKRVRKHRLTKLYEKEAREFEEELRHMGLSVIREMY